NPAFSAAAERTPAEVVAYLRGALPAYPGSGPDALFGFSPSNIVETMDTVVLDRVRAIQGDAGLMRVHRTIAQAMLDTLRDLYGNRPVLLLLDAGHGGIPWDAGSAGTEAGHNRAVAAIVAELAERQSNGSVLIRRIWNDAIPDRFGLPADVEKTIVSRILLRQARASMLAREAGAWNAANPERAIAVHEVSVHFNAGSNGAMVLHQGETLPPAHAALSVAFARRYLAAVVPALNATGLLPAPLRLWGGNGLHDDVMMYRPDYLSDDDIRGITLRYGALQGKGFLPRYVERVLRLSP
ncbi:MAG: hypothetical protein HY331_12730, partial [Chloroflexi bacterium]|nr:hypothetical protein [Chloroflexota bacterium]